MAALSIITGGGKWLEISIAADPLYQRLPLTAEKKFWRWVSFGEPPRLFGVEPPRTRIEADSETRYPRLRKLARTPKNPRSRRVAPNSWPPCARFVVWPSPTKSLVAS
jgi:hypothetical protein